MKTTPRGRLTGSRLPSSAKHGEGDVDKMPNRDVFVIDAESGRAATAPDDDDR